MKNIIDCLFIGHNEMNFEQYEKRVKEMGVHSGAYRDLNKNFLRYNNRPYYTSEIFNIFACNPQDPGPGFQPLTMGENFSPAIAYLGTWLHNRGYTFDYINSFQEEKQELAKKLTRDNILTIAITTTLYVSAFPILEIVDFIKKYNRNAKIIVGGPFVSNQIRILDNQELQYLLKSIDADFYVNSSQGEMALVKIIHCLKNRLPVEPVENIYIKGTGSYVASAVLKENNPLSGNMVNWKLFAHKLGKFISVRTSRSCPFSCSFCGFPEHAGQYRTASVEEVEKELNLIAEIKTVKSVQFIDDTFNVPKKRFMEILRRMKKNRYPFQWHAHIRCQNLDRQMVELMKQSGCEGVFLGIESGNNQILENMNKGAAVEKYLRGIHLLKEYDILIYGSFIIGFPGETVDTTEDTVKFIQQSGIDFYRAQLWYCDTVTPIWKERKKYNIKGSHFEWSYDTMDSKTACDLIDNMFVSIKKPIWIPQYNFEFDSIFHLLHRGMSLDQVKDFLIAFNKGIQEKLQKPSADEMSFDVIRQLRNVFQDNNGKNPTNTRKRIMADVEADFDF